MTGIMEENREIFVRLSAVTSFFFVRFSDVQPTCYLMSTRDPSPGVQWPVR